MENISSNRRFATTSIENLKNKKKKIVLHIPHLFWISKVKKSEQIRERKRQKNMQRRSSDFFQVNRLVV